MAKFPWVMLRNIQQSAQEGDHRRRQAQVGGGVRWNRKEINQITPIFMLGTHLNDGQIVMEYQNSKEIGMIGGRVGSQLINVQ